MQACHGGWGNRQRQRRSCCYQLGIAAHANACEELAPIACKVHDAAATLPAEQVWFRSWQCRAARRTLLAAACSPPLLLHGIAVHLPVADVAEVHGRMLSRHVLALQAAAAGHAAAQHLGLRPPAGRRRQPPAPPPTRQRLQPAPPLCRLACDDPLELCGGCPQARSEHDAIIAAIGRVEGCCTEHCFADRCSFRLTTHSARVLEAAAGPTMHLQPAPPRPPVAAAAKRGVVASSSAIQGGRAAPLRRQRRAAGGPAAEFNRSPCTGWAPPAPWPHPAKLRLRSADPGRGGPQACCRRCSCYWRRRLPLAAARVDSSRSPHLLAAERPGVKYDLVLSSGFLAFANHCGFLQAGALQCCCCAEPALPCGPEPRSAVRRASLPP